MTKKDDWSYRNFRVEQEIEEELGKPSKKEMVDARRLYKKIETVGGVIDFDKETMRIPKQLFDKLMFAPYRSWTLKENIIDDYVMFAANDVCELYLTKKKEEKKHTARLALYWLKDIEKYYTAIVESNQCRTQEITSGELTKPAYVNEMHESLSGFISAIREHDVTMFEEVVVLFQNCAVGYASKENEIPAANRKQRLEEVQAIFANRKQRLEAQAELKREGE